MSDTTKIGAALELIIAAASQYAVDRVIDGRLKLYGELAAALTDAEARGVQRERARCVELLTAESHGDSVWAAAMEGAVSIISPEPIGDTPDAPEATP
jgi:hypothetical protein